MGQESKARPQYSPERVAKGAGVVLIIILTGYAAITGNWVTAGGVITLLFLIGGAYLYIKRELSRREEAKKVAEEFGRSDEWKSVKAAITVSSVEDPLENEEHLTQLADLISETDKSSVDTTLSLLGTDSDTDEVDWERLTYVANALHDGVLPEVVGRVSIDPMEKIKRKHDFYQERKKVDPAHVYQAKQGNYGKAALAGVLEVTLENDKDEKPTYQLKIREHKEYDIPFATDEVEFTLDDIAGMTEQSGDLIEEGDVVKAKVEIGSSIGEAIVIHEALSVELLHENEKIVIDEIEKIEESLEESVDNLNRLVDLRKKGSINESEFNSQFDNVLTDALQEGIPPADAVDCLERLDVYKECGTISDSDYEYYKALLLDRESILMTKIETSGSPDITDTDLERAERLIA